MDLLLLSKSSFPWAKAEFASFFLGKTKGEQRGGGLYIFHNPSTNEGVPQLMCFLGGQVSINEGDIRCECDTHQSLS